MLKYRINNRTRFTLFIVIAIILITTTKNLMLGLGTADSSTTREYIKVEVSSGDTLWSIADTYMSNSGDIRKAVHELCIINDIDASELYAGMTISVPIDL